MVELAWYTLRSLRGHFENHFRIYIYVLEICLKLGIMMIRVLNIDDVWRTLRIMYTMYLVLFSGVNGEIPVEIGVLFYKYSQNHLFST